jgi:hypothetical protein|tara:strand:+ start:188 stop:766 length:579 start_codon:yes stop_codon:yes gene_type:complete
MINKNPVSFLLLFALLLFFNTTILIAQDKNDFPYFCDLYISYYPGFDGQSHEEFHKISNSVRAKTVIFHGEHPSHGPFEQLGVKLMADVCYKNENTGQVYVEDPDDIWIKHSNINVKKHQYSLTDFILIFLDDNKTNEENDECKDKWWTSFEEDKRVIIKVADIWQGTTAHYSTAYAISPEDIMINGKWICS